MPVSDYFAELFVAGRFADAGWNVYFPHRDHGFDFIVSKTAQGSCLVRPVQVKGKYPEAGTTGRRLYGYSGSLTQVHPDMVLVIPYFSATSEQPVCVAYCRLRRLRNGPMASTVRHRRNSMAVGCLARVKSTRSILVWRVCGVSKDAADLSLQRRGRRCAARCSRSGRSGRRRLSRSSINVSPMPDAMDAHDPYGVRDCVHDAVIAHANPPVVLSPGEFAAAGRARIARQRSNCRDHSVVDISGESA